VVAVGGQEGDGRVVLLFGFASEVRFLLLLLLLLLLVGEVGCVEGELVEAVWMDSG